MRDGYHDGLTNIRRRLRGILARLRAGAAAAPADGADDAHASRFAIDQDNARVFALIRRG